MNEIIVINGYSPSPGRSPAAQPCASNLKRENNHFYPRSISSLFSIEDRFNLNTDRRSNDKKKEKKSCGKISKVSTIVFYKSRKSLEKFREVSIVRG